MSNTESLDTQHTSPSPFTGLDDLGHNFKNTQKWAQNKIFQVQNNAHLIKSLFGVPQDLTKGAEELAEDECKYNLYNNYAINKDNNIEVINQSLLKKQKQVLGFILKDIGMSALSGKSIMNVSLPVTIFEPRSQIEREASYLLYAPHFLEKAGNTNDTLEQFKLVITNFVTTLSLGTNPQKPFNPILGETFQASIAGCPVYGEQISHHPPVLALQMLGKSFTVDATTEFNATLGLNSVKSQKVGMIKVAMKNNGTTVRVQYPVGSMNGTAMGKRTFQFTDKFYFIDVENKLYAEIDFDCDSNSVYKKLPKDANKGKDFFSGSIWMIKENFVEKIKQNMAKSKELDFKFKEKDHSVIKLETIEGHWMEYLKFGEKVYWSFGSVWPSKMQYFDNPLPSDSNFRLDILYLRLRDEVKAQDHKKRLEEFQREDRKLREQYTKKSKK